MMMPRELDFYEGSVYRRAEAVTKRVESIIARRYRESFATIDAKAASFYVKIGDPPTLMQARRYNRLVTLETEIAAEYRKLTGKIIGDTQGNIARMFTEAAYGTQWAIDQATGIQIAFPVIRVDAIRAAVENELYGIPSKKVLQINAAQRLARISATLTRSLVSEDSYATTARALKKQFQEGYSDSIRVVRTESNRAMNQGHLYTYEEAEELGVNMRKRWVATLDDRTRDTHGALDGQYADEDGLFWIGDDSAEAPGLFSEPQNVINCRCRVVEEIEGLEPELRRIRDEGVVDYITFEDWARPKGWTPEHGWPKAHKI
jgi:SPP1 gp7 family putative phage head morphogenesis protein